MIKIKKKKKHFYLKKKAPPGYIIVINQIESFNLESNNDFVRIYDGLVNNGTLLKQYTGSFTSLPNPLFLYQSTIQIRFTR